MIDLLPTRAMAFRGDSEGLRKYGAQIASSQPERRYAGDLLDLTGYLIDCDFEGAEAKIETLKFKYQDSEFDLQVKSTSNLIKIHIDFSYGRFVELEKTASEEISAFFNSKSSLEEIDILQILRILGHKFLILNEYEKLIRIASQAKEILPSNNDQVFYLKNSIEMMVRSANGEHRAALELAKMNLVIAEQNDFKGIFYPFDSKYIESISLLAMAMTDAAINEFDKLKNIAQSYSLWPWYFLAHGNSIRNLAINNEFAKALALIREERNLILSFNFRNELSFLSDANELFVRYLMKDIDRIEILVKRLPDLILVRQIKALKDEWSGKDMLTWINNLPETTARERIYKLTALADYYSDKETIAVRHMKSALLLIEETGSLEFLLRQHKLYDTISIAASEINTPFMEDVLQKISERFRRNSDFSKRNLPEHLTSRELEVVRQLSTGKPISAISASLHVSMNTMKTHLRNIYRKLDVDGREKAVEKAKELLLI